MALQILFWIVSAVCLLAAIMVVTKPNLVHAALYLVLTLFCVAVLFVLLDSGFFAVIQVLVYIGAIAILVLFMVMMTRDVTGEDGKPLNENWGWAAVIAVVVGAGMVVTLSSWPGSYAVRVGSPVPNTEMIVQLGRSLWQSDAYLVPTLVAAFLLLAAMIGAIKVAWPKQ
jgi:NADH:ubiquinone oxidoreductase subunit 6 (subunit J)